MRRRERRVQERKKKKKKKNDEKEDKRRHEKNTKLENQRMDSAEDGCESDERYVDVWMKSARGERMDGWMQEVRSSDMWEKDKKWLAVGVCAGMIFQFSAVLASCRFHVASSCWEEFEAKEDGHLEFVYTL